MPARTHHPLERGRRWASIVTVIVTTYLSGCAADQLSNIWRDESFSAPAMKMVYVVALRKDPKRRQMWEDSFVRGLEARGVNAQASHVEFETAPPDTQQVIAIVRRDGYDGVLASLRLPDGVQETVVPGHTTRELVRQQSSFTGGYYDLWSEVQVPERVEVARIANFRTELWATTPGGRRVWSGVAHTTDGVDAGLMKRQVEKLILPELSKAGLIPSTVRE
jgi:hypothetical protein